MKKILSMGNFTNVRVANSALALICSLALAACATRENDEVVASEANLDQAIVLAVDNNIIPAAQAFAASSTAFKNQAYEFCMAYNSNQLEALQQNWLALNQDWAALLTYKFGPLDHNVIFALYPYIDSYRVRGTNYTATVRGEISELMASDQELSQAYFSNLDFNDTGLLALELLSFEDGQNEPQKDSANIIASYEQAPRKCQILTGHAEALDSRAQTILTWWQQDYNDQGSPYRELFLNDELDQGQNKLSIIFTSAQEYMDYLHKRDVISSAAQVSESSWQSMLSVIDELQSLLSGSGEAGLSFFGIMNSNGYSQSVEEVQQNLDLARAAIAERNKVDLALALTNLDGNFKRQIPDALDIDLGLNFSDGD